MIFRSIRKFTENSIAAGAVGYIQQNPEAVIEMADYFRNAMFDPRPFERETADEVYEAFFESLLTLAKYTPRETDDWRHKLINWADECRKDDNKCGMYAYNIAAAAYSSALDAAKNERGAAERCSEFCAVITSTVVSKRNLDQAFGCDIGDALDKTQTTSESLSEEDSKLSATSSPDTALCRTVVCPECETKLPLAGEAGGAVRCPKCSNAFDAEAE